MSDTIPQSVSNGCRKYVKSRIIINTFNTFNNVVALWNRTFDGRLGYGNFRFGPHKRPRLMEPPAVEQDIGTLQTDRKMEGRGKPPYVRPSQHAWLLHLSPGRNHCLHRTDLEFSAFSKGLLPDADEQGAVGMESASF